MKPFILLLVQFIFIAVVPAQQTKVMYTCVMHPEVQMSKPGNCPKCGMTLVKKIIKVKSSKPAVPKKDKAVPKETQPANKEALKKEEQHGIDIHDHNKINANTKSPAVDTMNMQRNNMDTIMNALQGEMHEPMDMGNMTDPFSLHLPMEGHGSGTGWLPDASPMYGYMHHSAKWMYMLHGNIFLRYNKQDVFNKGSRGDDKFDAPNWVMFMGQRKVGEKGLFHFSTMLSLDPITEGGAGYPLLFQSGEAYKGSPIVDRQHPHDLFSELSVSYSHAFSKDLDAFIYVGYPGEPALGPVAFMHRPAALYNPDAPLSHHWSDATHITFGVATLGVRFGNFKIDASSFTGREPNAMRYDFDKPGFDSWSGRISYNPSKNLALQASHGFIKSPEQLHPGEDVNRTTASAVFSNGSLNISGVFGINKIKDQEGENSFLLEGSKTINSATIYSRYEFVQKSVEELALDENIYGHDAVFPVNAFTLGVNYDMIQLAGTRFSAGTQFSYYRANKKLNSLYGKNPIAFEVYIRVYPALMKMHKM